MSRKIKRMVKASLTALWLCVLTSMAGLFGVVTPPEKFLGFKVGADYHLATYDQAHQYFRLLEKESPKLRVQEMGKTGMGKPMIYALITSEDNMKNLDRYREISQKLALVEGLSEEQAQQLAAEGKAVVWISVGIHATECAPTQHALELAYDLIASEDPDTKFILDNTILILVFANPDGMELVADWYHQNIGTPYETSFMPWVYNLYAGHDNNRDSYMNNLVETQNITGLINRVWYPVVLYDHHQAAPFPARIWIPPAAEPTNPNLHPLFIRGKNLIGSAIGYDLDREGKAGAISRFLFDFIYPGYEDSFGDYFHIISIMTETALYAYATPRFYTLRDFPEEYRDLTPSAFYPSPWKGGWWRLRDAVEYCLTASKSVLRTAALYRERFLYGKYQMGKDVIARFTKEPPYAWIIPQEQWDGPTAALLVNRLLLQGIKIYKAEKSFVCDGVSYPAGTWVIPMNQPFALFIKAVFEEQDYPDMTKYPSLWQGVVRPQKFPDAYLPPYDLSGWSLPYQMGVKAVRANSPLEASLVRIQKAELQRKLEVRGSCAAYLISPQANNSFIAVNRILKKAGDVMRAKDTFSAASKTYPPGTFIVSSKSISPSYMESLAAELSLEIKSTDRIDITKGIKLKMPRVAVYKSWRASMDEGWTRWVLEQYEFPFANVHNAEIIAGSLREKFDAIIIPSMSTEAIVEGNKPGTMPPNYVGGISDAGIANIAKFVKEGGTLIALNWGCLFAIEKLRIPAIDALSKAREAEEDYDDSTKKTSPPEFACPGSILRMNFNSRHPVAYGMPEQGSAVFFYSPAFQLLPTETSGRKGEVIAYYPDESLLISGYLKGEKYLRNKVAAAEFPIDGGRVILLGFGVQNRAQPYGTFKLLFNALYY